MGAVAVPSQALLFYYTIKGLLQRPTQKVINSNFDSILAAGSIDASVQQPPTATFKMPTTGGTTISPALKRLLWDMYIGPGMMRAPCPLCGVQELSRDVNSGFEGAHIIAQCYFQGEMNKYYGYPSCRPCNNECRNACILDYLYNNGRIAQLRAMIRAIFKAFVTENEHVLAVESRIAHVILRHLYGKQRWVRGGGITKEKEIYEIARCEQYNMLVQEAAEMSAKLTANARMMNLLVCDEIKPLLLL